MLFLFLALAAGSSPRCSIADRPVVRRLQDVPASVRKALPTAIANPGEPFQVTDIVQAGGRPSLRLICGYATAKGYVIEREQGGRGYNVGRISLRRTHGGYVVDRTSRGVGQ